MAVVKLFFLFSSTLIKILQGFEYQLCTNYLGHFLLSHLLLPVLIKAGESGKPARVVIFQLFKFQSILLSGQRLLLRPLAWFLAGCLWSSIEALLCARAGCPPSALISSFNHVAFVHCAGIWELQGCTDHVWWTSCHGDGVQGSQCKDHQVLGRFILNLHQPFVPPSLHPGVIYTDLYSNVPGIKFVSAIARWLNFLK